MLTLPCRVAFFQYIPVNFPEKYRFGNLDLEEGWG
jgi:hypothetical protein